MRCRVRGRRVRLDRATRSLLSPPLHKHLPDAVLQLVKILCYDCPHGFRVDISEIVVNENISETAHLPPRHLRICCLQGIGDTLR
jgi:hypothetical protein